MGAHRLTIYLLRDISEPAHSIAPGKSPNSIELTASSGIDGTFYFASRAPSTPQWVPFIQPILATPLSTLTSSSVSGLLVLKATNRYFALTFGYGKGLLNPAKIEHQFGLRVALNRIDPRQIRSMDTKTFDDMVVTRNTQASKSSELPTFGVDISRDILRAVTGEPSDASFAKRLSGADALVMNVDIEPVDLPKLCDQLLQAFGEEKYKADFEWIDHLSLITDSAAKEQLNDLLVQQLQVGDDSSTHLAMPEAIGWEDIDAFKIAGAQPTEYEDLDLSLYLGRLGAGSHKITLGKLRSRRVSVRFTRTGEYDSRWTLYQCLISEQRLGSKLHVLIEGRWFTVSDSLVGEVDLFANGLAPSATALIPALHGEPEAVYNARLAQSQPEELLLLDARIKRPGGASSGIELCDLLTSSGEFIHVKRKSRSSTLSHLFAQGTVSARTFVGDGHFRDEMRKAIESGAPGASSTKWLDLVPSGDQRVSGSDYSVAYVVISDTRRQGIDWLPFFSKLNLMQHGKQLQSLGFSVSISRVDISK